MSARDTDTDTDSGRRRGTAIDRRRFLVLGGAGVAAGFAGLTVVGCSDSADGTADGAATQTASGTAETATGSTGSTQCVLTSNVTEGPYYLDNALVRKDIAEGKAGVPLHIRLTVRNTGGSCAPVPGAAVEIWHCDAWGYYSGFTTASPGGNAPAESADGSRANDGTYLRGYQIAGDDGVVEFVSIFPGWYTPRATHIHVKVHTGGAGEDGTYEGGKVNHTGQLFFDDELAAGVYELAPYTRHTGTPTRLADDMVYGQGGAKDGLTTLTPLREGSPAAGYLATSTLGVDPTKETTGAGGSGAGQGGTPPDGGGPGGGPGDGGTPPTGAPPGGGTPPTGAPPGGGTPPTGDASGGATTGGAPAA